MNVSAATENGYQGTYSSTVLDRSGMGKDAFLQLLVNQLRNQDPLNPVNDKEFLAQMAQFSTLEQMQNLNQSFEKGLTGIIEAVDVGLYDNFKALLSINNNLVMQQNFQIVCWARKYRWRWKPKKERKPSRGPSKEWPLRMEGYRWRLTEG